MTNRVIEAIKKYFDLRFGLFVLGAVFLIPIALTTNYLNDGVQPNEISIPFWLSFLCVGLSILIASYLIFWFFRGEKRKFVFIPLSICLVLILVNFVTTFLQPEEIVSHIYSFRLVYYVDITTKIELITKFVYSFLFVGIIAYVFVVIFVLPKLIKDIVFIKAIIYIFLAFTLIAIIYSLITESDKYVAFIQNIFKFEGNTNIFSDNALTSFFTHKNVYGLFLLIAAIACLLLHAFSLKIYYPFIALFTALFMILTYSKSSLLLAWILLLAYFYFYNIFTIKQKSRTKLILLLSVSTVIVAAIITYVALYLNVEKFKDLVNSIFNDLGTYNTRKLLWENVIQIITPNWMVTGRGFGVVETIIPEVSYISFVERLPHEHSWFYSLLAKGGVILVTAFISFLCYLGYLFYKSFQKKPIVSAVLLLGAIICFLQSFVENNYYSLFVFALMFALIIETVDNNKPNEDNIINENNNLS